MEVAIYVLNRKRDDIVALETRYGVTIEVIPDEAMHSPQYAIETAGPPPVRNLEVAAPVPAPIDEDEDEEIEEDRSEEHTSELQSLMRISYAVLCLKKKTTTTK